MASGTITAGLPIRACSFACGAGSSEMTLKRIAWVRVSCLIFGLEAGRENALSASTTSGRQRIDTRTDFFERAP